MTDKAQEVLIFETPDGGRTVYSRRPGETEKRLYSRDPDLDRELADLERQRRWNAILRQRHADPELDRLCEQVEIYFELSRTQP
jgi:hypothetical protein